MFVRKLASEMSLADMTQVFDRLAINSKTMANQLLNSGLKGDVNQKFIYENMPDMFVKTGELTQYGKNAIVEQLQRFGLSSNATIQDLYNGLLKAILENRKFYK
mgnify:CR=1 FL=1